MRKSRVLAALAAGIMLLAVEASAQSSRPARGDRGPDKVPPAQPAKSAEEMKAAQSAGGMEATEAPMDMAEYAASMEAATPEVAKKWLTRSEGRWVAEGWMVPGPGAPKMPMTGTDTSEVVGTWLVTRTTSNFGGMEMIGVGQTGWDMFEKKVVVTWIDTMAPYMTIGKGDYKDEDTLVVEMIMKDPMSGMDTPTTMVTKFEGDSKYTMTMTCKMPDGTSFDMMHLAYTRSE